MGLFKKKIEYETPIKGIVKHIEETPDMAFSQKMLGDGIVIFPSDGKLYAPCNGTIMMVFPTKHAIGIKDQNGVEILLHFGIDTVELKGQGFQCFVEANQEVKKGDLLLEVDLDFVKANATSECLVMILTSYDEKKQLKVNVGETDLGKVVLNLI